MSFIDQLSKNSSNLKTIAAIFVAGYLVNSNLVSTMKEINQPLVEKVASFERRLETFEAKEAVFVTDLSTVTYRMGIYNLCLGRLIDGVNKAHISHKEFTKPDDILITDKEGK